MEGGPQNLTFADRKAAIRDFLGTGGSVCPYAKTAITKDETLFASLPDKDGRELEDNTYSALADFVYSDKKVSILLPSYDPTTHQQAAHITGTIFDYLSEASLRLSKKPVAINRSVGQLSCNDKRLFIFGMSNCYDPEHPRYAPHFSIIMTDFSHIEHIIESAPSAQFAIMDEALARIARTIHPEISIEELRSSVNLAVQNDGAKKLRVRGQLASPTLMRALKVYEQAEVLYLMPEVA